MIQIRFYIKIFMIIVALKNYFKNLFRGKVKIIKFIFNLSTQRLAVMIFTFSFIT